MLSQRTVETCVGVFLLMGLAALVLLAFKVSGLTSFFTQEGYHVSAEFEDIGQLKVRGPVKMGGVTIGEITRIRLDSSTYKAVVTMRINSNVKDIPSDSSASILTAGLLGDNYIAINPMYSQDFLREGSVINETHSAMILEKMIGQFLFSVSNAGADKTKNTSNGEKP